MYYFSHHASGCETAEGAIFLDFRTGKYLGLSSDHLDTFRRCISDWPAPAHAVLTASSSPLSGQSISMLTELCRRGLLTESPGGPPAVRPQDVPTPDRK